uniref:Uncharacterized protein n=1 Tax=Vespula pensylvanica TaxID=30213 RepID=A0A834UFJ0_VESPE|nr:hypothetical protein H0235_003903 [Vespula pensylvanica]
MEEKQDTRALSGVQVRTSMAFKYSTKRFERREASAKQGDPVESPENETLENARVYPQLALDSKTISIAIGDVGDGGDGGGNGDGGDVVWYIGV